MIGCAAQNTSARTTSPHDEYCTVGDSFSTVRLLSTVGGSFSTVGDSFSTVEVVQYSEGITSVHAGG